MNRPGPTEVAATNRTACPPPTAVDPTIPAAAAKHEKDGGEVPTEKSKSEPPEEEAGERSGASIGSGRGRGEI